MGVFASIASWVWSVIAAIGAAIAIAVTYIVSFIGAIIASIATYVGAAVSAVYAALAELVSVAWVGIVNTISSWAVSLKTFVIEAYTTIGSWVTYLSETWKAFAEFIHLDLLIKLNNLGMLLSSDYREFMQNIYGQISKVSGALGLGAHTMTLAFRNARNLVLDVSSMTGVPYDIAEVQWLGEFSGFLKRFELEMTQYKKYPERLFLDLDARIVDKSVNAKSSIFRLMYETINQTIDATTEIVASVDKVNNDVKALVDGLPESVRERVQQYTLPITQKIDSFIDEQYFPAVNTLGNIVNSLAEIQNTQKAKFDSLVDRMKRPANYLKEIDTLALPERTEQERIIGEIAGRSKARITDVMKYEVVEMEKRIDRVIELQAQPVDVIPWFVPEQEEPNPLPQSETGSEDTWFVGEY